MSETLVISQYFALSPARLFLLLSKPDYLEQWLAPSDEIAVEVAQHDFTIGGKYILHYTQPSGEMGIVAGEFTEIEPPERISFTWLWQPPDAHAGIDTLVTWQLAAKNTGAELTIIHQKIPDQSFTERHQLGWQSAIKRLLTL